MTTPSISSPLGWHVGSASPGETTLLETVLADVRVPHAGLERLIADRGYDSDPLAPHPRPARHSIDCASSQVAYAGGHRMDGPCDATADAGSLNAHSPGYIASVDSWSATNVTP